MIYFESGVTGTYGVNHPRIAWNSVTRRSTITAATEATGFEAVNVLSPYEYTYWKATNTSYQTLDLTFDATETVNAVCLTGHNLGTIGATLRVFQNTGSWVGIGPVINPTDDSPIAILFEDRDLSQIRIALSGLTSIPYISVLYVCEVIEFPVRTYTAQGAPANMSRRSDYMTNETINGKWVGRTLTRSRNWVDVPIKNFSETWAATNLDPLLEDARSYPYFILPRPGDYPKDIQYKWAKADLIPERLGIGGNLMQVKL